MLAIPKNQTISSAKNSKPMKTDSSNTANIPPSDALQSSTTPYDIPRNKQEATALCQLRELLDPSSSLPSSLPDSDDASYFLDSDGTLLRFLRERDGNVERAVKMIHSAYNWRSKHKPKDVVCPKCATNPHAHNMRVVGWDKEGRPVIYMCFSQSNDRWDPDANCMQIIQGLESAYNLIERRGGTAANPSGRWVFIVDFEGYSLRDNNPRDSYKFVKILSHYPQVLSMILAINAPGMFSGIWNVVRKLMHPATAKKVKFLTCNTAKENKWRPELEGFFGNEMAYWLASEIKENAEPKNKFRKKFWEWLDEDGQKKDHDPRGTASYVSSKYYISPVPPEHCTSRSLKRGKKTPMIITETPVSTVCGECTSLPPKQERQIQVNSMKAPLSVSSGEKAEELIFKSFTTLLIGTF